MVDVDQETPPPTLAMLFKSTHHQNSGSNTKITHTSDWIDYQKIASNITVVAGETTFTLDALPLVSKCGYFRKLISEDNVSDQFFIEVSNIPGGGEAFKFAVNFCHGKSFEINAENVAMIRCVAEHLEMTEDYADGNLTSRMEEYLNEVALTSLPSAITVLRCSESFLPLAETIKLVSRCIDAIAYLACKESQFCLSFRNEQCEGSNSPLSSQPKEFVDWWAEDLTALRIDIFQRVLVAMKARGFKPYALGTVLMLYAQKSLRGLDIFGRGRKKLDPKKEHEKRVVLEIIVGLLPRERNAMSVSFLTMLLRASVYLETTVACRLDLEKRIGLQLGQAVLDDLLIPSFSFAGDTVFDVDTVQRILVNYLEHNADGGRLGYNSDDEFALSSPSDMEKVGKLMEFYLAEIASDPNLTVSRFVGLAELIPEQARITEDEMYRAIDIYLKAHSSVSETERKKICIAMDCQRLSREACAHAAQNERLPVQVAVQVLYYEQQRLRDVVSGGYIGGGSPVPTQKSYSNHNATDELTHLRRENDDLKRELARMRAQLNVDKCEVFSTTPGKPPMPKKSLINSMSKKFSWLNPFVRSDTMRLEKRTRAPKDRWQEILLYIAIESVLNLKTTLLPLVRILFFEISL